MLMGTIVELLVILILDFSQLVNRLIDLFCLILSAIFVKKGVVLTGVLRMIDIVFRVGSAGVIL